jgi:putative membrane-bound dehydrogenase-like protein
MKLAKLSRLWSYLPWLLICPLILGAITGRRIFSQQTPGQTTSGLKAAEGLEVTLWAAEPDVINPTNIDIDSRGRIWVAEGVNYRLTLGGRKKADYRPAGDRITILEDTDGDGRADKVKVFVQDQSLRTPLGISVLGDKVIVSQSPDIIVYTKDEQDNIVKKEVLLTGFRGIDHDHGVHAVVFGPDGRYYLDNGDQGLDVTDKSGTHILSSKNGPYFAGTALRLNPDGTGLTAVGHNFRNPYELALDSFGTIWQSDNDDDGNAWVRVNYVMEGGNFGYWGPTARHWWEDKGLHFHSNLPGVVPNIGRTGAGAPCGLVVYEGKLLPSKYRGQLIHAEAGKRLINTYFISPDGAGYAMKAENTVSAADPWFRPSDVVVSPDGAIYISDWYDPGVGGHQMVDTRRGRIYRLAPIGYKPQSPKLDLDSSSGLSAALASPAQSVRYLAYQMLRAQGPAALPALQSMLQQDDAILRARALWLLGGIKGEGEQQVKEALQDKDPNFRILGLRILRFYGADLLKTSQALLNDPSPQVRREVALALQYVKGEEAVQPLLDLCRLYDGKDRWYLESLGIAARGKENLLYPLLTSAFPGKWNSLRGQFIWEFRPSEALPYLISSLQDNGLTNQQRTEVLEALSVVAKREAGITLAEFVQSRDNPVELVEKAFAKLSRQLFSEWSELRTNPAVIGAVKTALKTPELQSVAVELTDDLEDPVYGPELLALAKSASNLESLRVMAAQSLGKTHDQACLAELEKLSQSGPLTVRAMAVRSMGLIQPKGLEAKLKPLILSKTPNEIRTEAVRAVGRSVEGCKLLLDLEESGELPSELRNAATNVTNASSSAAVKARAQKLLPPLTSKNKRRLPPLEQLLGEQGDAGRGKKVFIATAGPKCKSCHSLEGGKKSVGPNLSAIGSKLGKQALLESILNPSAGIAPEFYVWILQTKTQGDITGILTEDTPQRVTIKTETAEELRFRPSEITSRRRSYLSLMPEDLVNTMTKQQLVDLLEFLTTLKEGTRAVESASAQ